MEKEVDSLRGSLGILIDPLQETQLRLPRDWKDKVFDYVFLRDPQEDFVEHLEKVGNWVDGYAGQASCVSTIKFSFYRLHLSYLLRSSTTFAIHNWDRHSRIPTVSTTSFTCGIHNFVYLRFGQDDSFAAAKLPRSIRRKTKSTRRKTYVSTEIDVERQVDGFAERETESIRYPTCSTKSTRSEDKVWPSGSLRRSRCERQSRQLRRRETESMRKTKSTASTKSMLPTCRQSRVERQVDSFAAGKQSRCYLRVDRVEWKDKSIAKLPREGKTMSSTKSSVGNVG